MSSLLWKAYYEDDVDSFRQLLEASARNVRVQSGRGGKTAAMVMGSPGGSGTSPTMSARSRKMQMAGPFVDVWSGISFTKADINWRDANGMTILHHVASSTSDSALEFATLLVEQPLIDLYLQDYENGWTALHRAFYFGNITIARLMLERDTSNALGQTTGHIHQTIGLVKVKDREGNGPLDLFGISIKDRTLHTNTARRSRSNSSGSDDNRPIQGMDDDVRMDAHISYCAIEGDEVFTFGSNKNVSLGFGDEDDRQYPERITVRRPEHLLRRFYKEHLRAEAKRWSVHDHSHQSRSTLAATAPLAEIPWMVRSRPITIQGVHMAKFHTAVLTADPESNLYLCGHGQGGRLGVGDERTRFHFVCVDGGALAGKKVADVALGQNHTLALSDEGEIFSWGSNAFGQLGYSLPKASGNEDPIGVIARQIYGPLKRETITGIAASRIHSVAYTASSLYTFGKNEGQLGIVDSDARSLEMQIVPRKVAASLFSSTIVAASAIDRATVCLLENHDVWIFANYGYARVQFPLEGFTNYFLKQSFLVTTYDHVQNHIAKVTSAGDTICAMSSRGEIYTVSINRSIDNSSSSSTTNPSKIRNAITDPQCIWSPKKSNMAARDVGIDADGSVVLATEEGSVWKRTKRAKLKNATAAGIGEYKPKDYKFSRIPGLTRILAVRASSHGAYAAVKRDCSVTKTEIVVEDQTLWKDLYPLMSLRQLYDGHVLSEDENNRHRFWQGSPKRDQLLILKHAMLESKDVEADLSILFDRCFADNNARYDAVVETTTSDIKIPVHRFVLAGRSRVLRRGFRDLCEASTFTIPELAISEIDDYDRARVRFQGLDVLTVINLVLYMYTDSFIDFWHLTRDAPKMAHRYRQVRIELMKIASKLELVKLEPAVRQMTEAVACLGLDLELASKDPVYFFNGDIIVHLQDSECQVHSALVCARCPFFEGLFMGRAGGRWLAGREDNEAITVDLKHITTMTFNVVLRHIYADAGEELFDDIVSANLDDFIDTVLDVLSAANELMLDRLSQICQAVLGRFVNVRNVCWLLNAVSPSSIHEFKDAALEYLCLSLEAMLQGHFLNELDEDLQLELDDIIRENQRACMPFAKSGRAESDLHERHPELAEILDRGRRSKIDAVMLRAKFQDIDTLQAGSLDDEVLASPIQQKARRRSSYNSKVEVTGPSLRPKASAKDMMFAMDEEPVEYDERAHSSPTLRPKSIPGTPASAIPSSLPEDVWYNSKGKLVNSPSPNTQFPIPGTLTPKTPRSPLLGSKTSPNSGPPWSTAPLPGAKTDMKDILGLASSSRTSSLSQALASAKSPLSPMLNGPSMKLSQKERKRMQQAQQLDPQGVLPPPAQVPELPKVSLGKPSSPWQTVSAQKVPSLRDVIDKQEKAPLSASSPSTEPTTPRASSTPQLTMRQTLANPKPGPAQKPVIGPGGQSTIPTRSVSETKPSVPVSSSQPRSNPRHASTPPAGGSTKPIPHSIRHAPLPVEPSLQLSMSDILAQQQAEKDIVKEAAAKRDLQEIQAEQEFQEWWDKESARVQQEAERRTQNTGNSHKERGSRRSKGRVGGSSGSGSGASGRSGNRGKVRNDGSQVGNIAGGQQSK